MPHGAPAKGPKVRVLGHLRNRQDQQEGVGSWSPEMNLVWDQRATHAHIDRVCVLSDEGNDGGALEVAGDFVRRSWSLCREGQGGN